MRNSQRLTPRGAAVLCAAVLSLPALAFAQAPAVADADRARAEAEARARNIERSTRENARQLTLFDKEGKVVATVGERSLYNQPVLSPTSRASRSSRQTSRRRRTISGSWISPAVAARRSPPASRESRCRRPPGRRTATGGVRRLARQPLWHLSQAGNR
jgi:hypothetical protein